MRINSSVKIMMGIFLWLLCLGKIQSVCPITIKAPLRQISRQTSYLERCVNVKVKLSNLISVIFLSFLGVSFVPATLSTQVEPNWLTAEGQNCMIYYEDNIDNWFKENVLQIVAFADDCVAKVVQVLNISYNGKMEYFFYSSPRYPDLPGATEGKVFAFFPPQQLYISTGLEESYMDYLRILFVHETVHALDYMIGTGALTFFREGLAVYVSWSLQEGRYFGYNLDDVVSGIYATDGLIPLNKEVYDWSKYRDYLQSGSFVKFLITNYGLERFKQFFSQGETATIETLFQEFYSRNLETMKGEWTTYLKNHEPKMNVRGATSLVLRNGMDVLIVYGTSNLNATENELAKEAAENMQRLSETLTYLKYDNLTNVELAPASAVTPSELASKNIVLVGNSLTNPFLAKVCQYLPLTVENSNFTFKDKDYIEKNNSIVLSYLNPYNTSKYVIIIAGNSEEENLKISEILLTYFQTFEQIGFHYMVFEDQIITSESYFESFELRSPSSSYGIIIGISILASALAILVIVYRWTRRKTRQNNQPHYTAKLSSQFEKTIISKGS
jgi:hypothetical protein